MTPRFTHVHDGTPIELSPGWNRLVGIEKATGLEFSGDHVDYAGTCIMAVVLQAQRFTDNVPSALWRKFVRLDGPKPPDDGGTGKGLLPLSGDDDWGAAFTHEMHVAADQNVALEVKLVGSKPIWITTFQYRGTSIPGTAIEAVRNALPT